MAAGNSNTPFLDHASFIREEVSPPTEMLFSAAVQSPFVSVYELANGEASYDDPAREAYASLVNELYDEEFSEALFELSTDLRGLHQSHCASGYSRAEADRLLGQHVSQLATQAETAVDAMAQRFAARGEAGIVDHEVDSFVEGYTPAATINPAFENLFGKLFRKIGSAVKKVGSAAWKGVKNLGWGLIFNRVKAIIRPFLNKVLQKAIGKLPAAVQPAAQKLAQRLGFALPQATTPTAAEPTLAGPADASPAGAAIDGTAAPDAAGSPASPSVQEPAGDAPTRVQEELDQQIAEAMLAQDEFEVNLEVARLRSHSSAPATPVFSDLDAARERFIRELASLREGESAEPYIQNFLPLLLPALKLGLRIGGRSRVVNLLAQLLAKLIGGLIGPAQAPALSRAIVDAGLKLLNLEMSEQERSGLAASAVAATVEETVSRVASLPDHVLDNQELLEGFALEAFEQAAAANLPSVLSERTYRQRPELLEAGVNAAWFLQPFRYPRYKRCSRSFRVKITPHMAEEIESFEGSPLSDYLQDQLGIPEGESVEAEVHLYEALPGTTVADITGSEAEVSGLGSADEATIAQLHPLTHEAAGRMFGRSALGRALPFASHRRHLFAGQRLYHLAVAGRRPLSILLPSGRNRVRRLAHLKVVLDAARDQIRVSIFLSERKAQRLGVRLRQAAHSGSLAVGFSKFLSKRLGPVLHGHRPRRLRIVHPGAAPTEPAAALLAKLPGVVPQVFVAKVAEWLLHAFTEFTKNQAQLYIAAADSPADGVTLRFTVEHPQGLKELCQALVENGPPGTSIADTLSKAPQPNVSVEVFPGHKCG